MVIISSPVNAQQLWRPSFGTDTGWDALPSSEGKHAGSDSHPVRIGWEALARSGPDDSCTPACFRTGSVWPKPDTVNQNLTQSAKTWHNQPKPDTVSQNLTQSAKTWHNQPELNRIRSVLHNVIRDVCGKLEAGRLRPARNWARWFLDTSLLPDQMRLAKPWPGRIRAGFAQYDPCLLRKNGAETDAGSWIRHILSGPIVAARWP